MYGWNSLWRTSYTIPGSHSYLQPSAYVVFFQSVNFQFAEKNVCVINLEQRTFWTSCLWDHCPHEIYQNHYFTMFICYGWAFNLHTALNPQMICLILICYSEYFSLTSLVMSVICFSNTVFKHFKEILCPHLWKAPLQELKIHWEASETDFWPQ